MAIVLAAVLSSIGGSAFSAICGAMLFHLDLVPVQAVEIMLLCSIANQAFRVCTLRRAIDWRDLVTFLAGGALGLPIGIWLLLGTDHRTYTHVIGAFLLAYGAYMLIRRPVVLRRQPAALDVAAGVFGGITEDAEGFPGASVTILCAMTSQPKDRQRAIFQPFILISRWPRCCARHRPWHAPGLRHRGGRRPVRARLPARDGGGPPIPLSVGSPLRADVQPAADRVGGKLLVVMVGQNMGHARASRTALEACYLLAPTGC